MEYNNSYQVNEIYAIDQRKGMEVARQITVNPLKDKCEIEHDNCMDLAWGITVNPLRYICDRSWQDYGYRTGYYM